MEINYLKEAFQRLSLLEDDFNLSADSGVVDELKSFVADDIEAPEEEAIIDVEAETEDELKDSYIGKVILECDCCHARIYKDIADVVIDDKTGLANVEERCPVCSTESGFNVIGKIEEFNQDEFKDQPEDAEPENEQPEEDVTDEEDDFVVEESFKSALKKILTENNHKCSTKGCDDDVELELDMDEAVNPIMDRVRKKMMALGEDVEEDEDVKEDEDELEHDDSTAPAHPQNISRLRTKMAALESLDEDLHEVEVKTENGNVTVQKEEDKVVVDFNNDAELAPIGEDDTVDSLESADEEMIAPLDDEDITQIENNDDEPVEDEPIEDEDEFNDLLDKLPLEGEEESPSEDEEPLEDEGEPLEDEEDEEANESLKTEKFGNKVDESFGWPMDLDDADPEDRARYEAENGVEIEVEEPYEDPYFNTGEFDIDDFDEESFDEIGESYLRKVYENVDSFLTESVNSLGKKLTVEGLITFTSGKKKHTSFVFENIQRTKRGKVVLEGYNKTFSNSTKAFNLKGNLTNKQFVSESMIYNYNTKVLNESNELETAKVYGRVVVKK